MDGLYRGSFRGVNFQNSKTNTPEGTNTGSVGLDDVAQATTVELRITGAIRIALSRTPIDIEIPSVPKGTTIITVE